MLLARSGWYLAPCPALRRADITFKVLGSGSSQLVFSDVLFLDSASNDIAVGADAGTLQAVPERSQVVPEPAAFLLFGAGLVALGVTRSKRNGAVSAIAPAPA